jgi:hypothetical protein
MHMVTNPKLFYDSLEDKYIFIVSGVGKPSYHLGGNFERNENRTLAWGSQAHIRKC